MPTTEPRSFISHQVPDVVSTDADKESPATVEHEPEDATKKAWQRIIDDQLIEWGRAPAHFVDEGVEPLTGEAIRLSIAWAQAFRDNGFPPPDSVLPDPNGGIVFERRENDMSEVFHVWDDGTVEYRRLQGARLIERRTL